MKYAGYRTALMGKYLNHYPGNVAPKTYVPPGWDEWAVPVSHLYREYGYRLNENGRVARYGWGEQDYLVGRAGGQGRRLHRRAAGRRSSSTSPRSRRTCRPTPPYGTRGAFPGARAPRTPSFNREDVSREPVWLRSRPPLTESRSGAVDRRYRNRMRAMLGVDDLVGSVVETLRATGKLDNTYIFFTSDNGFHLGTAPAPAGQDHAVRGGHQGPARGARAGDPDGTSRSGRWAPRVDLAPTISALGGAVPPPFAEGRSLLPVLHGRQPAVWRQNALIEFDRPTNRSSAAQTPVPPYRAVRTPRYTYVKYSRQARSSLRPALGPLPARQSRRDRLPGAADRPAGPAGGHADLRRSQLPGRRLHRLAVGGREQRAGRRAPGGRSPRGRPRRGRRRRRRPRIRRWSACSTDVSPSRSTASTA